MLIRTALIVYKKSAFQTYFKEYKTPAVRRLARVGDKVLTHIRRSHEVHYATLRFVQSILKKKGIRCRHLYRGQSFDGDRYDLIISVGGDGTFMDAARHIHKDTPILGVNSDTNHSVGKLCAADRSTFESVINRLLEGRVNLMQLGRMSLRLNGKPLGFAVLNDILACHPIPAAMSHYILEIGKKSEQQRSSGVWVATAAGSTGVMKSAGGRVLALRSDALQYMPRELFEGHGANYRLRGGVARGKVTIISQMQEGVVYADGAHVKIPFNYGCRLEASGGAYPLNTVVTETGS